LLNPQAGFQYGNKPDALIVLTVQMAPCVCAFRVGMALEIENLYVRLPDRFAMKHFMVGYRFTPNRPQLCNCEKATCNFAM
jgi:hypothetical protein